MAAPPPYADPPAYAASEPQGTNWLQILRADGVWTLAERKGVRLIEAGDYGLFRMGLEFAVPEQLERLLWVRGFQTTRDPVTGLVAIELVAAGREELCDVDGSSVGRVHGLIPEAGLPRLDDSVVEAIKKMANASPLRAPVLRPWGDQLHMGQQPELPALWFSVSTAMAASGFVIAAKRKDSSRYREMANVPWLYWLQLAKHWQIPSQRGEDRALLADLLSLPSLTWVYRADISRATGRVRDNWSSVLTQPRAEIPPAFDCEDGSHALMVLYWAFVLTEHDDAELVRLQTLAREYQPAFAIVEIKVADGNYQPHCLVVLVPEGKREKEGCITLESTAYASGYWDTQALKDKKHLKQDTAWYREYARRVEAVSGVSQGLKDAAPMRSPISMVDDQKMYGKLLYVFRTKRSLDSAFCDFTGWMMGYTARDLFLGPERRHILILDQLGLEPYKLLMPLMLQCEPQCFLPESMCPPEEQLTYAERVINTLPPPERTLLLPWQPRAQADAVAAKMPHLRAPAFDTLPLCHEWRLQVVRV